MSCDCLGTGRSEVKCPIVIKDGNFRNYVQQNSCLKKRKWTFPAQKKSQVLLSGAAVIFCAWNQVLWLCGLCHWWQREHASHTTVLISRWTALELCAAKIGNILENMHPLRNHRAGLCCCLCLTPSRLRSGMTEATIRWGTCMWRSSWRECQIANDLSDPFSFCLLSLNCSQSTFGFHSRDQCLNNRCYPSYWCTNKHSRSSWYEVM